MIDYAPNPTSYARQLATYISDPSKIHSLTHWYWGKAPSLAECRRMREKAAARNKPKEYREQRFECGHPRALDNILHRLGRDFCRQCREKSKADAAKREKPQPVASVIQPVAVPDEVYDIPAAVAKAFSLTLDDITGAGRKRHLVNARMVAARLLRDRGLSLNAIKRCLGMHCHSSVANLLDIFPDRAARDPTVARVYAAFGE